MKDVIIDTLLDAAKLLPFLFIAFLIIELIEHKFTAKSKKMISKSDKFGPFIGGLLGLFPQCGFSVMATNLYVTRIVTLGTLVSIYLTTSDEMLPILISEKVGFPTIISILGIKFVIGVFCGFIIDLVTRRKKVNEKEINDICETDHCHCEKGILVSTLIHTLKTLLFIVIISFLLNVLLYYVGEEYLAKIFMKNSIFGPFISSLVGLIPNCASSIMITELYLNNAISLGSLIGGVLTGSGVAILVLFKSNKNLKENFMILALIYGIGAISGVIINLLGMIF